MKKAIDSALKSDYGSPMSTSDLARKVDEITHSGFTMDEEGPTDGDDGDHEEQEDRSDVSW